MTSFRSQQKQSGIPTGLALLTGAAAGFAAGVFVTSKAGLRLRTEAGRTIDEYSSAASGRINEIAQKGRSLACEGAKQFEKVKSVASDKLRKSVGTVIDTSEGGAHEAIDTAVRAVQDAGVKSHEAVGHAAETLRSGTRG